MQDYFSATMLAVESQKVVGLRLAKLFWGGPSATREAHNMVSEKIVAMVEATGTLICGGSVGTVISRYREIVAANTRRLSAR